MTKQTDKEPQWKLINADGTETCVLITGYGARKDFMYLMDCNDYTFRKYTKKVK